LYDVVYSRVYKMQSETADFVPGAATWPTERNIRVVFDSLIFEIVTSSTKSEVHNMLHYRPRRTEPRPQVTYSKYDGICMCGLRDTRVYRQTHRQTEKQTDTLIAILRTPTGGEILMPKRGILNMIINVNFNILKRISATRFTIS